MDLTQYPFAIDAGNSPPVRVAHDRVRQKLRLYLARLYIWSPAESLLLVGLPGIDKTRLRDPIIRIVTTERRSLRRHSHACLSFFAKPAHGFVKRLKASNPFDRQPKNNADWATLFENMGVAGCSSETFDDDPYLPALIASFQLRNWVTAE